MRINTLRMVASAPEMPPDQSDGRGRRSLSGEFLVQLGPLIVAKPFGRLLYVASDVSSVFKGIILDDVPWMGGNSRVPDGAVNFVPSMGTK